MFQQNTVYIVGESKAAANNPITQQFSSFFIGFVIGAVVTVILAATNKTVNGKRNYLYPLIPWNGRALARLVFRLKKMD